MKTRSTHIGMSAIFGLLIGVVLSSITGQWWWIGVGFGLGFGVAAMRKDGS